MVVLKAVMSEMKKAAWSVASLVGVKADLMAVLKVALLVDCWVVWMAATLADRLAAWWVDRWVVWWAEWMAGQLADDLAGQTAAWMVISLVEKSAVYWVAWMAEMKGFEWVAPLVAVSVAVKAEM